MTIVNDSDNDDVVGISAATTDNNMKCKCILT